MRWLEKAAEKDIVYAQMKLGQMYEEGDGVPKDLQHAAKWYGMAAMQGNDDAKQKLIRKLIVSD